MLRARETASGTGPQNGKSQMTLKSVALLCALAALSCARGRTQRSQTPRPLGGAVDVSHDWYPPVLVAFGATEYPWPWQARHRPHNGVDFAASAKEESVVAIADGVVTVVGGTLGGQRVVWIFHPQLERLAQYHHLANVLVSVGDHVRRGHPIANMWLPSNTPWVMHVHLMICRTNCSDLGWEDPMQYLHCSAVATPHEAVFPLSCTHQRLVQTHDSAGSQNVDGVIE
jgi:Peptidase family M23